VIDIDIDIVVAVVIIVVIADVLVLYCIGVAVFLLVSFLSQLFDFKLERKEEEIDFVRKIYVY